MFFVDYYKYQLYMLTSFHLSKLQLRVIAFGVFMNIIFICFQFFSYIFWAFSGSIFVVFHEHVTAKKKNMAQKVNILAVFFTKTH